MPASARKEFISAMPASKLPTLRRARPTARSASSACRFWLTLAVMRKSSINGAETRRARAMPVREGGSGLLPDSDLAKELRNRYGDLIQEGIDRLRSVLSREKGYTNAADRQNVVE